MSTDAYLAAIAAHVAAEDTSIRPWLTDQCPDCRLVPKAGDPKHVIGIPGLDWPSWAVLIGCEGYWVVNPNAVGIAIDGWHDWRPEIVENSGLFHVIGHGRDYGRRPGREYAEGLRVWVELGAGRCVFCGTETDSWCQVCKRSMCRDCRIDHSHGLD